MNLFKKILGRSRPEPASDAGHFDAPLAPDAPFFVIGDIHGSLQPFQQILQVIEQVEERPTVVCVGDYIDRGEQSAQVLDLLKRLSEAFPDLFYCLKGNHEQMCLDFIDSPETDGKLWLRNGGLQTLASYGIGRGGEDSMTDLRDKLVDAMGEAMIAWLRGLPLTWRSGNVVVVHAAADPARPIDDQSERTLMWGHSDFATRARSDGIWVAHGHTIVKQPHAENGRIAVDTGAYATGTLSGAYITENDLVFIDQSLRVD